MRTALRLLAVLLVAGVTLAIGGLLLARPARAILTASSSKQDQLQNLQPLSERSVVYAKDGSVLAVLHAEENRLPVKLDDIPKPVIQAILDVEDDRFYEHGGFDVRSTLRALYANVNSGGIEQGGSTITQQLVKNAYLTHRRTAGRKVKEAVLAVRLEKEMSKDEILERYLNTVYLGNGTYGLQAAAEKYFGVDVGKLDQGQAAFLAGLIRNPVGYDPFRFPDRARQRRDQALGKMQAHGDLDAAQALRFAATPVPAAPIELLPKPDDYFVEEVKQRLLDDPRLGDTPSERYQAVFEGGLQIHTTLDPNLQHIAEDKVRTLLPDTKGQFTASLVSLDPTTGAVRALVGGPGFEEAKYNLATQGHRQAGSSFKIFTLVAALEKGHSPKDTIDGHSPCSIPNPGGEPDPWKPENFEGEQVGTVSLTDATVHSVNCAYAKLALLTGLQNVADTAAKMGVTSKLDVVPSMTLGASSGGVSPLEMASAYSTLAADGVHHEPYFIERVADRNDKDIFKVKTDGKKVVDVQAAREAVQVMQEVVKRGTGTRAQLPGRQVAGKTGTAQDYRDAWFIGFTPQLATSVWMGSPLGEVPMKNVGGIRVVGGSYPARIWQAFMAEALKGLPAKAFPAPDDSKIPKGRYLQLRVRNGKLVTDDSCDTTVTTRKSRSHSSSTCTVIDSSGDTTDTTDTTLRHRSTTPTTFRRRTSPTTFDSTSGTTSNTSSSGSTSGSTVGTTATTRSSSTGSSTTPTTTRFKPGRNKP